MGGTDAPTGDRTQAIDVSELVAGRRLAAAAGVAGLVFALLLTVVFLLLRVGAPPGDPSAFATWLESNRSRIAAATYLIPFTGIAFIWFVAAVRQRIGYGEGLFFSTLFLGSALLLVATLFVTGAAAGAMIAAAQSLDPIRTQEVAIFSRALAYALYFGFSVKMGGMFMLVVASIGRGTEALPRWLTLLSIVMGLLTLVVGTIYEPTALVFPAWVALVSVMLIRLGPRHAGASAVETGPGSATG